MNSFFATTGSQTHQLFGFLHITILTITIFTILFLYIYRKQFKQLKNQKRIKNIMLFILFTNMNIFYIGSLLTGSFTIQTHLPLHYCFITGYLFMYMIWKEKKNMFNFLYYAIFMCTITVIIWQDPYIGFNRYEFYQLIFSHHFLLICMMYTLFVWEYPVEKSGLIKMAIYSVIVYISVWIFNYFTGSNYIFSDGLPKFIQEYYPFLTEWNPVIPLLIVGIPLTISSYLPISLKNRKKSFKQEYNKTIITK